MEKEQSDFLTRIKLQEAEDKKQEELDAWYEGNYTEVNEKYFERTYNIDWLIPELIERNTVCVLYGQKGTHKSFIALHLGYLLANEYSVLGSNVEPNFCTQYLRLENPTQHDIRLQALKTKYPIGDENIWKFNFFNSSFRLDGTQENLDKIDVITNRCDLLIIDTLSYIYPDGDETKGHIARKVMHELSVLAEKNKCTILAIHHPPESDNNKLRGSSEIANATNTIIKNEKGKLKTTKQRNGIEGKVVHYEMLPVKNSLVVNFTNPRKSLNQYRRAVLEIVDASENQKISNKELTSKFVERFPDTKSIYEVLDRARKKNITDGFLKCDEKDEKITYKINE